MPKRKYRIGVDARLAGKQHAGIGRYIENLLVTLAEIQAKNIEWFFFFYDRQQADEFQQILTKHHHITFVYAPIRHYSLAEQIQWPKILKEYRLDLLHVPHFNIPIFYSGKIVVTIHDLLWHQQIGPAATTLSGWKYYLKYLAYRLVTNQAVRRAAKIFVPAQTVKKTALTYYPQAEEKIVVTKEGIAPVFKKTLQALQQNPDEAINRQRINQLIYVGSLYPHKNIEIVLKALPKLPNITLKIVCSRNVFFERTQKLVQQLNLSQQVIFTGYLNDDELVKEINHSLALVQPSKSEGFGLTGIEAMACGTPVIASDIPIFSEIYAQIPYYFHPEKVDDFIQAFLKLQQRKDYANKIKMGYQQAGQYDWQQMTQLIFKEYSSLLPHDSN